MKKLIALVAVTIVAGCGGSGPADPIACESIQSDFKSSSVTISSSKVLTGTGGSGYCRVEGVMSAEAGSSIKFATNIPRTGWNGRFIMLGNGGYAGGPLSTTTQFLGDGYATAVTDTGHTATDGSVFYNNRPVEVDYAYRAVHMTADVSKSLLLANQGKAPAYSYFNGCSTGGRQGLISAQRYPADFDGVLAGSPALQLTGLAVEQNWSLRQFHDNNFAGNIFGKVKLLADAVKASCADAEGIISKPEACQFDAAKLSCPAGTDAATCLTPAQVASVKAVYGGPKSSTGTSWYTGKPMGSEASWALWLVSDSTDPAKWAPAQGGFGFSFVNNLFFEVDPPKTYQWTDFNFETDPTKQDFMAKILNATDPDLSAFNRRNAKLIVYHGMGDGLIGYQPTQKYMQNVRATMGTPTAAQFSRLFLVPGMDHCDAADRGGLQVADWMAPLVKWVENGQAPDSVPGRSRSTNPLQFTRPVCADPKTATYNGTGSRLDAANWSCS